jgi:hypothetical protein
MTERITCLSAQSRIGLKLHRPPHKAYSSVDQLYQRLKMFCNLRSILSIGFGVAVWGLTIGAAQAQFGGLQIQIGRGPYSGGGLYVGGFNVPFGVGPSIPLGSRAYMGPQYQSGYRGYYGNYGVAPSLGIYGYTPLDPVATYRNYIYSNRSSFDQLQQYQLQQNQLELQEMQRSLSAQQAYPYDAQSRYSGQSPRVSSSSSDLRPGMVLPDGSTVISVGPISPADSSSQPPNAQPSGAQQQLPSPPPNVLPPGSPKPNRASF